MATPRADGLTSAEAAERLALFGPNLLPEEPLPNDLVILLAQLRNPLVYVLGGAALITAVLRRPSDTAIILIAVLINATLGFWQERRANRALAALRQLVKPQTLVVRDGEQQSILLSRVVPGDLAVLAPGGAVPADGEVIEAVDLFVNEALLTGESQPVRKTPAAEALMGTIVVSGRGRMRVAATGARTKMGGLATSVAGPAQDTPLQRQLRRLSRALAVGVGALTLAVFLVGLLTGRPPFEMFLTAVALAVSTIPEGLLISTTAVLAIGMVRILQRKGLVRRLLAAETLGGVTVICADKTGTLTEGTVRVVSYKGDERWLLLGAVLCNNLQDPLEVAEYEWARVILPRAEVGGQEGEAATAIQELTRSYPRIDEVPFSSALRYQATLCTHESEVLLFVAGAPEIVLAQSDLPPDARQARQADIEASASAGYRLLGFGYKRMPHHVATVEGAGTDHLTWAGLLLFEDPVRPGVREALSLAEGAGIAVKVITGDYPGTALHLLAQLGKLVAPEQVLLGDELAKMTSHDLAASIQNIVLFARTNPAQKLAIVQALKERGGVVAMMGDGVNDAPALARADIGIVVGSASDVARETADLVLLDSNLATVVAAVEEGRGIFDNLRKIVLYLLSDAFGEIIVVAGSMLLALPLPLTAAQILWIDLVSDGFPDLAITVDPKRRGILEDPPRDPREPLVTRKVGLLIGIIAVASGLIALGVFVAFWKVSGQIELARSVTFLTLGVNTLLYVFSVRNLDKPAWGSDWLSNRWLIAAVLGGFALQALPFYVPMLRDFFDVVPLDASHWLVALSAALGVIAVTELAKALLARPRARADGPESLGEAGA